MSMKSECESVSPVMRKLDVIIDGEDLIKDISRAYRQLGTKVKIPGFRKGKIPRQVLERYYKQDVESDVLSQAISRSYSAAIDEHALKPVNQPQIKNSEFIPGQDFRFTAEVEVRPDIELVGFRGLEVTREDEAVSEDNIAAELERLRAAYTQVEPVEDRKEIEAGDLVATNFSGTIDGEAFQGSSGNGYILDTTAHNYIPEVIEALIGKPVGEAFEVEATVPEGFKNEEVVGKTAQFKVTPTQIKRKRLPELDDEFAKDVGDFETLAALKVKVQGDLEGRMKDSNDESFKEAVIDALIEKNPFDVPPTLIERQIDLMLYQTLGQLEPEQLKSMGVDVPKLREEMREKSEWKVRRGMLLEHIADIEKIEVGPKDLEERIAEVAERIGQPIAKLKGLYKGERAEELQFSIRLERALDLIIGSLVGASPAADVEAPPPATEAAAAPVEEATSEEGGA